MNSVAQDLDLENFVLPHEFRHQTQQGDYVPNTDPYGIGLAIKPQRWGEWVVKLGFKKQGEQKFGNGFFVNIPNAKYDVILTAGHNLVQGPGEHCTEIKIITATSETPVLTGMIDVCQRYLDKPDELNAIYDYGIIRLARGSKPKRGFGFSLKLGLAPPLDENATFSDEQEADVLQNRWLYVSGYRPDDSPATGPPQKASGKCLKTGKSQLQYEAEAIPGISGGPVWLGYRGVETVVAIHNYGAENSSEGNRGSRLNLEVWRTICGWVNMNWIGKSLHYRGSKIYSMHLHMHLQHTSRTPKGITGMGRVRVGSPGRVDTRLDIFPVSAPADTKDLEACYACILRPAAAASGASAPTAAALSPSSTVWLRWEAQNNKLTITDRFDDLCEVRLLHVTAKSPTPFDIQARAGREWMPVRMAMATLLLDEGDLELLADDPESFEDTSEVSFVPLVKTEKLFEFK